MTYLEELRSLAVGQVRRSRFGTLGTVQAIEGSGYVLLRSRHDGSHQTRRVWGDIVESWALVGPETLYCADCNRPEAYMCPGTLDGHHSHERESEVALALDLPEPL